MKPCRVHITGASGTGTTTLGRLLASTWSVPHADSDDYFWAPSVPPYTAKRPERDRLALMEEVFVPRDAWVLSGSLMGWGDALAAQFDAVVFLTLGSDMRLERLATREQRRYGNAIGPGGPMEVTHREFMEWAASYDDPGFSGRNRVLHDLWLDDLTCPVLHLDSAVPEVELVVAVQAWTPL